MALARDLGLVISTRGVGSSDATSAAGWAVIWPGEITVGGMLHVRPKGPMILQLEPNSSVKCPGQSEFARALGGSAFVYGAIDGADQSTTSSYSGLAVVGDVR